MLSLAQGLKEHLEEEVNLVSVYSTIQTMQVSEKGRK